MATKRLWVLGASDPEMAAIETLLRECGEEVMYALGADGERVSPGTAYSSASPRHELIWRNGEGVIFAVECAWQHRDGETGDVSHVISGPVRYDWAALDGTHDVISLDHHRPGDHGFDRQPRDYMAASTIGQVISALAWHDALPSSWPVVRHCYYPTSRGDIQYASYGEVTDCEVCIEGWEPDEDSTAEAGDSYYRVIPTELLYVAAADHCLGAAYAGQCPGVDPDALLRHRVAAQVAHRACAVCGGTGAATGLGGDSGYDGPCHGGPVMTVESVLADIEGARSALETAPRLSLGTEVTVADMRGCHVPSLPDAGTRYGVSYIADGLPGRDGRVKIVCSGTRAAVDAFMRVWGPCNGLVGIYGDPARGFAGGYVQ